MKKRSFKKMLAVVFAIAVISSGISTKSAIAIGVIDLDVYVNPNYGGSFSGLGDTTGTAFYDFRIESTSSFGANLFTSIQFERDIFASIGTPVLLSGPVGYSLSVDTTDPSVTTIDGVGVLLPGESFQLTVDYTLTDTNAFFFGTDPSGLSAWAWSMDGPDAWSQGVTALYFDGTDFALGGGSTIPNPEPASLILMGTGLVGLGLWGRRRNKKA